MISPTSWTLLGGGVLAPGSLTQLRHRPQLNSPRLISQSTSSVPGHFSPTSLLLGYHHCTASCLACLKHDYRGCTALSYLKLRSTSSKFRTESQDSSSLMTNRWKISEFCVGGKPQADWTLPRNQVLSHHRHSLKHFPETQTDYPWEL